MEPINGPCSFCARRRSLGVLTVTFSIVTENGAQHEGGSRYACAECAHKVADLITGGHL